MVNLTHQQLLNSGKYTGLSTSGAERDVLLRLYEFMVRLRRVEQAVIDEYHPADEMRCPVHFCIGQEAVPSAVRELLDVDDYLFSHHRTHGYYLAKRGPLDAFLAELYGKATGANCGKAGSMDLSYADVNFFGGAILGGAMSIAVGTAFGLQMRKSKNVAVTGIGDGATEEGVFWEAINYSALKKLPILFICENNNYSTYSPQSHRQLKDNLAEKVSTFGVESGKVFGNDVVAVYRALKSATERMRQGSGPYFLEAYTYRWSSHVGPEDDNHVGYRMPGELEYWKENCPIALMEEVLMSERILTTETKSRYIESIDSDIKEAFKFAKESPFPPDPNWLALNTCLESPLADQLLVDTEQLGFNENQPEAVPGPY